MTIGGGNVQPDAQPVLFHSPIQKGYAFLDKEGLYLM